MKVGVWLNEDIDKQVGGGYSYIERIVSLIDNKEFSQDLELVFISKKTIHNSYKKEVITLKKFDENNNLTIKQKSLKTLIEKSNFFNNLYKENLRKIQINKTKDYYINQLKDKNIDVIYYLSQMECPILDYPFISTNWDIGHLSMFSFPEVTFNNIFENRDNWYEGGFKKALSIFSESESGKQELISYLNINPDRIKVLPIFPGGVVHQKVIVKEQQEILRSFDLEKNQYFFYPAQFWAHKNHYNLLLAFKILSKEKPDLKLIFTGSDKGNLNYIKEKIKELNLQEKVIYLGFLELDVIYTLYRNAIALVMPTFLGPTNMPLLEARALECPILCSDINGHREQLEDGAIYFDPTDDLTIYESMCEILDNDIKLKLLEKSKVINITSKFNEENVIKILEKHLIDISKYRNCWG